MGIAAADGSLYEAAVRKLFPQGDYWDRQFADPESDVSLFCKAKVFELTRFRSRMAALLEESNPATAAEMLEEWERVLLGSVSTGFDVSQRRSLLLAKQTETFSRKQLHDIALSFGFTITDIRLPYLPSFFGFSRFGIGQFANPAAWNVIVFHVSTGDGIDGEIFLPGEIIREKPRVGIDIGTDLPGDGIDIGTDLPGDGIDIGTDLPGDGIDGEIFLPGEIIREKPGVGNGQTAEFEVRINDALFASNITYFEYNGGKK